MEHTVQGNIILTAKANQKSIKVLKKVKRYLTSSSLCKRDICTSGSEGLQGITPRQY